jgi:hypothetical protein
MDHSLGEIEVFQSGEYKTMCYPALIKVQIEKKEKINNMVKNQ